MKKVALTKKSMAGIAVILLLSSLVGLQAVEVVKANPFWIFHPIEPIPGTVPPRIIIFNPQNNTAYSSDNITISFYLDKPKLDMHDSSIINITYTLDDKTEQAFTIWKNGGAGSDSGIPNFNTSFISPTFSTGNHRLTVYAEGVVFAGGLNIFFINSSSTIFFAIGTQPFQPSPTPTTTPLTSSNRVIASNSLSYTIDLVAVFSITGLFAIIETVIVYKRKKQ